MKIIPFHLKYVFLKREDEKIIIIINNLTNEEDEKLIVALKNSKQASRQQIYDIKGINASYSMHNINLKSEYK